MGRDYQAKLEEVRAHLREELLPFWLSRGVDEDPGGFLTYFDRNGEPTGESVKTLICQARCLYSFSAAHRAGHGDGVFLERARQGYDFLVRHFWDQEHGGWNWTAERDGAVLDGSKLAYGQSFAIYGLSEYAIASGDAAALEWAERTYDVLDRNAFDEPLGGYTEFHEADWAPKAGGAYGGDRKSMDVHMHLMEAFTSLYEASGDPDHRDRAVRIIGLILEKVLHREHGTGVAQFTLDWKPLRQILFRNVWGADRDVDDPEGRPLDNTSYGHNVELAWLLNRSIDVLGLGRGDYLEPMRKLYDHCVEYGIDREQGGVFCEGAHAGPARERNKEFWQQAETLVGMLDAVEVFGDDSYWAAYENVHRFVFDTVINHEVGEWWPLFGPGNEPLADHMAHAWKINYHTIRSMIECEGRLERLAEG